MVLRGVAGLTRGNHVAEHRLTPSRDRHKVLPKRDLLAAAKHARQRLAEESQRAVDLGNSEGAASKAFLNRAFQISECE